MAIKSPDFSSLKPIEAPDPLDQYKQVLGIRGTQLQQQDTAAQIQERQAIAKERERQTAEHQQINDAIHNSVDPATGQVDWDKASSAVMGINPTIGQNLSIHAENIRKQKADVVKGEAQTQREADTLKETQSKNAAEELDKRKARERQEAQDRAGALIPQSELLNEKGEKTAQYRVLQQDGTYTNETRVLGKQGQLPPQPTAPMSPERYQQETDLAKLRARLAEQNKVDPTQILQGKDDDGKDSFFVFDKKTQKVNKVDGLTPKGEKVPAPIQQNVNVAGKALDQSGIIRKILGEHPEMVGPTMGRLDEFMQGLGSNPFAGDPKLEQLGATLTGHLRYLFAQELKNAIGGRPGEFLAKELKEGSPQRKQDINLLKGFLDSVENNANVTLRAAKQQYQYDPFHVDAGVGAGAAPGKDPLGVR